MLIGVDGGGTKTALCLADEKGHVLAAEKGLGTNPADLGIDECFARLQSMLNNLLSPFGGMEIACKSAYIGLAGSSNRNTKETLHGAISAIMPHIDALEINSDVFNSIYAELLDQDGLGVIAGTGSSTFAFSQGAIHQIGGWGYLVDDIGSGFRMGSDVLKAAYRAFDGRGPETTLREAASAQLGMPLSEAIPTIYGGGKRYVASFAPLALQAAQQGDVVALAIVEEAAQGMADHIRVGGTHIAQKPVSCVLTGGLMQNDYYMQLILHDLGTQIDEFTILRPQIPPLYGALARAALNAGIRPDENFRKNFLHTYHIE